MSLYWQGGYRWVQHWLNWAIVPYRVLVCDKKTRPRALGDLFDRKRLPKMISIGKFCWVRARVSRCYRNPSFIRHLMGIFPGFPLFLMIWFSLLRFQKRMNGSKSFEELGFRFSIWAEFLSLEKDFWVEIWFLSPERDFWAEIDSILEAKNIFLNG